MTSWIKANDALAALTKEMSEDASINAICRRAHGGMIQAIARRLLIDNRTQNDALIDKRFWWREGGIAGQDWVTGDFATAVGGGLDGEDWRAFDVSFDRDAIMEMLSPLGRVNAALAGSVATNPEWITARAACHAAHKEGGVAVLSAGPAIVEYCRSGLVAARAIRMEMCVTIGRVDEVSESAEWDVPTWLWSIFQGPEKTFSDWQLGKFSGHGVRDDQKIMATVHGVHFLRSNLVAAGLAAGPTTNESSPCVPDSAEPKPPVSERGLHKWWEKRSRVRDNLSVDDLWVIAQRDHPENHVSRDKIRALTSGRKRGPKPRRTE